MQNKLRLEQSIGFVHMYEGRFRDAGTWLEKALETGRSDLVPAKTRNRIMAVLGIVAMRRGEIENCLECAGPSSCIFPIAKEAQHQNPAGSREAIKWFTAYLEESPRDLRIIVALEHRVHDAWRAPRESAGAIPDPDRGVSLECGGNSVRECRASSRDRVCGARIWQVGASSTI